MSRIRTWVNQLSVKKKLIFYGYLIISPVLIIICGVLLFTNYKRNSKSRLDNNRNDVLALAEGISVLQTEIKDFSSYICINDEVRRLLMADNVSGLNQNSRVWQDDAPMQFVQDMISLKGNIQTISIYPENGLRPYLRCMDGSAYYSDIESVRQSNVYLQTLKSDDGMLWKCVEKNDKETFQTNRQDKLVLYREVYDMSHKTPIGFITIGVKKEGVQNLCDSIVRNSNEGVIVLDRHGGELCRSGEIPEVIEQYLMQEDFIGQNYRQRKDYFTYEGYTIVCTQKERNSSIICKVVPPVNKQISFMEYAYTPVSLLLGVLIGLLPLLIVISNIVTKPLQQLSRAITKFSTGDFEQQVEVKTNDEIGEVARCFNKMVEDIKTLIDENYVITLKERESELTALQAQINPHFLYNTLDTLYWQATEEGNDEIAESIFALSQLFRLVLSQGKKEVMVSQEMELVSRYLQIQKMRFSERLNYEIEVEDEIKDAFIPKLIVQPFVENAIVHGFENVSKPCYLTVKAKQDGQSIRFEIEDTGVGMSEEQIAGIWEEESPQYAKQRIGRYAIKNIKERLELKYHDDFNLEIQSTVGKGTTVILRIPIED